MYKRYATTNILNCPLTYDCLLFILHFIYLILFLYIFIYGTTN